MEWIVIGLGGVAGVLLLLYRALTGKGKSDAMVEQAEELAKQAKDEGDTFADNRGTLGRRLQDNAPDDD
jgi:hypothetical protein